MLPDGKTKSLKVVNSVPESPGWSLPESGECSEPQHTRLFWLGPDWKSSAGTTGWLWYLQSPPPRPIQTNTIIPGKALCVQRKCHFRANPLLFPALLPSSFFWKFWRGCFRWLKGISEDQILMPPFQYFLRNWIFIPRYVKYNLIYKVWSVTKHSQKWTSKCTTCLSVFEYWKQRPCNSTGRLLVY